MRPLTCCSSCSAEVAATAAFCGANRYTYRSLSIILLRCCCRERSIRILAGDEQADLSVHGGLDKAVYAYPQEHYAFWQAQRREQGVSLFDEGLPPGFVGENLSISGLLEADVFVGDELHFAHCVLRVTAPREPCFKFNAVMGFNTASKLMAVQARCGFYLSVAQPGTVTAGEAFTLVPGRRALSIQQAISGKLAKHLR
jgi:MOSC domain-containing protein YiiM